MVILKNLQIKQKYRYVWLKYVSGFDLSQHCAKCLNGTYEPKINKNVLEYSNIELKPSPYYYFCTVYKYDTNIHLAFTEAKDRTIKISNEFYSVEILNAERIIFDNSKIDRNLSVAKLKAYNTCRNWWFANWIVNG